MCLIFSKQVFFVEDKKSCNLWQNGRIALLAIAGKFQSPVFANFFDAWPVFESIGLCALECHAGKIFLDMHLCPRFKVFHQRLQMFDANRLTVNLRGYRYKPLGNLSLLFYFVYTGVLLILGGQQ